MTDLFAPHAICIRGAERLARNMGDHDPTDKHTPATDSGAEANRLAYIPPAGISLEERLWNVLVVGRELLTTSILMNYAIEDILAGRAVVWIASDGSARKLLEYIPAEWVNEVIFVSPGSTEDRRRPIAWNPLNDTTPDERFQVAEAVTAAFGSIYKQFWGPQSAMLLQAAVHANLDLGGSTLLGCLAMLSNDATESGCAGISKIRVSATGGRTLNAGHRNRSRCRSATAKQTRYHPLLVAAAEYPLPGAQQTGA